MRLLERVIESYEKIKNSDLILNKVLSEENIIEFQNNLNYAQPENDDELKIQELFQYMYKANPINFIRFLLRSRLHHLILWTEYKCIIKYFGIYGIVYIKWDDNQYKCQMHKNADKNIDVNDIENQLDKKTYYTIYKKNMRYHGYESSNYKAYRYSNRNNGYKRYDNSSKDQNPIAVADKDVKATNNENL